MSIFKRFSSKTGDEQKETLGGSPEDRDLSEITRSIRAEIDSELSPDDAPTSLQSPEEKKDLDVSARLDTPLPLSRPEATDAKMASEAIESERLTSDNTILFDEPILDDVPNLTASTLAVQSHAKAEPQADADYERLLSDVGKLETSVIPGTERINLSELRLDVVRITSDIESGESLYRRAQQRIDSLIGFIEQAEVAVSVLNKLEPEARHLKTRNRTLETDLKNQNLKLLRLDADLEDQRKQNTQARAKLETSLGKLSLAAEMIRDRENELEKAQTLKDEIKIQAERTKTSLEIETQENISLREKMSAMSTQVETLTDEKLTVEKELESLRLDYDDVRQSSIALETQVADLRVTLKDTERQNQIMRDELVDIQNSLVSFKDIHDSKISKRDSRLMALEAQNKELTKKLEQKDAVVQSAVLDVSELRKIRTAQEIEQEKLEKIIEQQNFRLNQAEDELLRSKQDMADLDTRYKNVAEILAEKQRQRSNSRRRNLDADIRPSPLQRTEETILPKAKRRNPKIG